MKFSVTLPVQYDTPFSPFAAEGWERQLERIAAAGFEGAELCISDYEGIRVEDIKRRLEQYHLKCPTISTGQAVGKEGLSLIAEGRKLEETVKRLRQHIDFAADLGSMVTIGLLRGNGAGLEKKYAERILAEHMEETVRYAEKKGVTILLEGLNRYESGFLNTGKQVSEFIRTYFPRTGNVKVLWDTFHANMEEASLEQTIGEMGGDLGHVHLADSNRSCPGLGHLDFRKICGALSQHRYDGFLSYECLNGESAENTWEQMKKFKQLLNTQS